MMDNQEPTDEIVSMTTEDLKLYSKQAVRGFSVFFSSIFGAVLLMQNLKDIGKKKEANLVLMLSILYTIVSIYITNIPEKPLTSLTYLFNIIGALILTEYFYKKYIPDEENIEKKKIWKPLIISLIITAPFVLAMIFAKHN